MTLPERRVLLVSMPMAEPTLPNLGMEILAQVLRHAGQHCDVLYGSLLMPKKIGRELLHSIGGQAVFAPAHFGLDPVAVAEALSLHWHPGAMTDPRDFEAKREAHVVDILIGVDAADQCLAACLAAIPARHYDVVAFSLTFDAQKLPSIALAAKLKQRDGAAILFGGSACDGGMGLALMERFEVIDAVAEGDSEGVVLGAVAALRGEQPWGMVPNCHYRANGLIMSCAVRDTRTPLDCIPTADFGEYLRQKTGSEYDEDHKILMFESSRGCWWGEKHHCTFCGLRADGLAFRERAAELVVEEVCRLQEAYAPDLVYATDGILGRRTLLKALPAIARWRRRERQPLNLFYEIKSNLKQQDAALLAAAGVSEVQPGIESFSTGQLRLMRKGATALQQIECLKWLSSYGISVTYALLIGLPGEVAGDYEDALALMPNLHHLAPAMQVNFLVLDQFSPYSRHPEAFEIHNVRPMPEHHIVYQQDDADWLLRATYERNYDHGNHGDPTLLLLRKKMRGELLQWQRDFRAGNSLLCQSEGKVVTIYRTTSGALSFARYGGLPAQVLQYAEHICGEEQAARRLNVPLSELRESLESLAADGLLAREDGRFLSLALPIDVDPWRDAGFGQEACEPMLAEI